MQMLPRVAGKKLLIGADPPYQHYEANALIKRATLRHCKTIRTQRNEIAKHINTETYSQNVQTMQSSGLPKNHKSRSTAQSWRIDESSTVLPELIYQLKCQPTTSSWSNSFWKPDTSEQIRRDHLMYTCTMFNCQIKGSGQPLPEIAILMEYQ